MMASPVRAKSAKWLCIAIAAALIFAGLCELAVRASGLVDIPLYNKDGYLGYIPQANQHGAFLHRNDWRFNSLSMAAGDFTGGGSILIGDSLVLGGNPLAERERPGTQLGLLTAKPVWPIAAASWGLINELRWLETHRDVVRHVQQIIFLSNSDDFGHPSIWTSEFDHPTHRPISAFLYAAAVSIYHKWLAKPPTPGEADWQGPLRRFARASHPPVCFVLWTQRGQSLEIMTRRRLLIAAVIRDAKFVEVAKHSEWRGNLYRDNMHENAAGAKILAQVIKDGCGAP